MNTKQGIVHRDPIPVDALQGEALRNELLRMELKRREIKARRRHTRPGSMHLIQLRQEVYPDGFGVEDDTKTAQEQIFVNA